MQEQLEEIGNIQLLEDIRLKDKKIVLDFGSFKIKILPETYEDFVFMVGNKYDKKFLEQVLFEDDKYKVIRFVLSKYTKHELCENDIRQKVYKKFNDISKDATDAAMQSLIDEGVINDKAYVEQAKEYFEQARYGKYYILNFFKSRKISDEVLSTLTFDNENEKKKAEFYFQMIKNKYVSNNIVSQKKKIFDALLKRGFSNETASYLVSNLVVNSVKEHELLVKDYLKIKKKLATKSIESEKLFDNVMSSLLHRGYNYDEINKIIILDKKGELKND